MLKISYKLWSIRVIIYKVFECLFFIKSVYILLMYNFVKRCLVYENIFWRCYNFYDSDIIVVGLILVFG